MRPLRIAALQPSISITLEQLGALDSLVACTKYCITAVPALNNQDVHIIHDSWSANTDEILATRPDIVLASVPYRMESLAAILRAGLAVLTFAPKTLADIYNDLLILGRLVDSAEKAEHLVSQMQLEIGNTRAKLERVDKKPRVYCEEWGKPLIHSQPWVAELVEASGGVFVGTPAATTDAATIADLDPDVLLFAWCGAGKRVPLEKVVQQRDWPNLQAVRTGRVYCIDDAYLNTPATTLLHGLHAICAALHPDVFGSTQGLRAITRVPMNLSSI